MSIRFLVVTLALMAAAACTENTRQAKPVADDTDLEAVSEAYNATVADKGEEVVCEKESQTGTRIKKVVCRTRAQIERERREAESYIDRPRPTHEGPGTTPAGRGG